MSKSQHPWSSDTELVAQILSGSRDAFEMLYEAYFPRVYRFALKRLHDAAEAEDVAQEVFFTVFNVLDSYQGQAPLIVWVFGITRNTVNRRFRRKRLPIESLDAPEAVEVAGATPPADRVLDARRMLRLCEQAIERDLTPLQRRIFHLKHLRRQSIRTIARALGKSEDAIKANLYRMRMALAQSAPGLESLIARARAVRPSLGCASLRVRRLRRPPCVRRALACAATVFLPLRGTGGHIQVQKGAFPTHPAGLGRSTRGDRVGPITRTSRCSCSIRL